MSIGTGLRPKLAEMCGQIDARLGRAEAEIARMARDGPDIAAMEAATVATDFATDMLNAAVLFDIPVPEAEPYTARLGAAHAALDGFDRVLRDALGAQVPARLRAWAQGLDRPAPAPIPQAPRAAFLTRHSAVIEGTEVTLADMAALQQVAPEVAGQYWETGFAPQSSKIAEGFAECLMQTYAEPGAAETALAGTLDLPVALRPRVQAAGPMTAEPDARVFTSADHLLQTTRDFLARSNHWGAELSELFAQGCISVGAAGPEFPLTLFPDPDGLPMIHVPFSGRAGDAFGLFHQIGHALHQMRSAKGRSPMAALAPSIDELVPVLFERLACDLPDIPPAPLHAAERARRDRARVEVQGYAQLSAILRSSQAGALDGAALERFAAEAGMTLADLVCGQALFKPLALSSFAFGSHLADGVEAKAGARKAQTIDDLSRRLQTLEDLGEVG